MKTPDTTSHAGGQNMSVEPSRAKSVLPTVFGRTKSFSRFAVLALCVASLLVTAGTARAQTKTWTGAGSQPYNQGIWGGNGNWNPSGPANGADNTAYFTNTFNNGFVCIVNTARTIGNIWFTHPANTTDFTLLRHASDFTLTLAVSSTNPVVNVTQGERTLVIDAVTGGTNGLAKNGAGTLIFTRTNTYTGTTFVNAGTLRSRTGSATTGFSVASGTTNIIVVDSNLPQLLVAGDWTNANSSVLGIDYAGTTPSTNLPPIQVNNLSLGSGLTCRIFADLFSSLLAGQSYPLITWTGSGPSDASAFTSLVLASGVAGNLSVSNSTLYLNITANTWGPLNWNTGNGNWDTTTTNWLSAALAPALYSAGDAVLFGDASGVTGNPTVTINAIVAPTGVTMNSTNHDYTFSGTGGIGGANGLKLEAANTRTLTLLATTNNSYSGGITINGGTLRLGGTNVIPDGPGTGGVAVNAGGTFDVNSFPETINYLSGNGLVDNTGGGAATLSIGADNSTTFFSGILANTSGILNVNKSGTGQLSLSGSNTFTGSVIMNAGTLSFDNPVALATVSNITLAGGTILNPSADNSVINGSITLGASNTTSLIYGVRPGIGSGVPFYLTLNGPIVGAGNVTFSSANQNGTAPTIILNAPGTYTGSTLITCDTNASAGLNCYVRLGTNNGLPATTVLTFDGIDNAASRFVQLELNGFNQTLAGLTNVPRTRQQVVGNVGSPATLTLNIASNFTFTGKLGITGGENFGLTKGGVGRMVLGGVNAYNGPTTNNAGILEISTGGQLGAGSYAGDIVLALGTSLLFTSTNSTTLSGAISGSGTLTNAGAGLVTISGSDSLPNTVVAPGSSIAISGGFVRALTVNAGGAVNLPIAGTATNLLFAGTGAMNFDVAGGGTLTVVASNGVTNNGAAGSITINITGSAPTDGTYTLIAYSGSLQGSGFSAYQLGLVPGGKTYALVNTGSAVQLTVAPAMVWTGAQSSEWSINPIGGLQNWTYNATPSDYTNGLSVVFDDTVGAGSVTPDISVANITPNVVQFNHSSVNYTLQGSQAITGAALLQKDGSGTLTVVNNNTYTGLTVISGGVVQVGTNGPGGSLGLGPITQNADLQFNRSDSAAVANAISGTGTLSQNGTGTLTLSGTTTYTGATTVNAGTLNLAGMNTGSSITVTNSAVLTQSSSGVIAGSGVTLVHASTATSTLSGSNTFTGAITVSAGELDLTRWGTNSLGAITVSGASGAVLGISGTSTYSLAGNSLLLGTGGTTGTVNQTGGTVAFTNGNALLVGNGAGLGSSGTYNLSGGTLTSYASVSRGVLLGVNHTSTATFNLSGTGNLALGGGQLAVGRNDAGTTNCTVAFNQTGGTATVSNLCVGGQSGSSATTATFSLTGGTFSATNFQNFVASASSAATVTLGGSALVTLPAFPVPAGTANLTFDFTTGSLSPQAASTSYLLGLTSASLTTNGANFNVASGRDITVGQSLANAPSQVGTLRKTGVGALTLTNASTYSGSTTVSAGTLRLSGVGSIANSAVLNVVTNATLSVTNRSDGTLTVGANQTLMGGGTVAGMVNNLGTLAPGASIGTLTISSNLVLAAGSTNIFEVNGSTPTNDIVQLGTGAVATYGGVLQILPSGTFTVGQTFALFKGNGTTNASNFASISGSPGSGKTFSFANGVLSVVGTGPSGPAQLTNSLSGSTLTLTWPAGQSWRLVGQTNNLSTGLIPATNAWFTVPGGVDGSNSITINTANPTVFYRLVYP